MSSTIAIVFDFDDTLAPDSTTGFLAQRGVNTLEFWNTTVAQRLDTGWDPVPAYLYEMIQYSNNNNQGPITQQELMAWGQSLPLHEGVKTLFTRLRAAVKHVAPQVQLEFYMISSGIYDVVKNTSIAHEFTDIWASDFAYDDQGQITFPKKIISFTDKTRYLFHIQKGLIGERFRNKPFEVNRKIPNDKLRVPFENMIFVGDGYTDIPCFSMIRKAQGIAFGVWDPKQQHNRQRAWGFLEDGRVTNLNHAKYNDEAELYQLLEMASTHLARKLAIDSHSYHG